MPPPYCMSGRIRTLIVLGWSQLCSRYTTLIRYWYA
jgi:hypothetical protein